MVSTEKSKKLENLSTVMTLYSRRTFSKESLQWTKCVVKYLYDAYSHLSLTMLSFLVEVLEKGPPTVQPSVLTIIYCMAHYVDLQVIKRRNFLLRSIDTKTSGIASISLSVFFVCHLKYAIYCKFKNFSYSSEYKSD